MHTEEIFYCSYIGTEITLFGQTVDIIHITRELLTIMVDIVFKTQCNTTPYQNVAVLYDEI